MSTELDLKKRELVYKLKSLRSVTGDGIMLNETSRRIELRNLLQVQEVRDFYNKLQLSLRQKFLQGGALVVPEMVEDRIKALLSKYSGLYDEVQVVPVGTDGRVAVSVGEAQAKWHNFSNSLEELQSSINLLEMEDIKVGGFIPVSNGTLDDNIINMALYLEELLAKSIAFGIDNGIINGVGDYETVFEPVGILKNLPTENTVTISTNFGPSILANIAKIDIGKKEDIGEVIAVMKRKTYYKEVLPYEESNDFDYPTINNIRVKFSGAVADNTIILGDFKEYILAERNQIKIQHSEHQFFTEEQTIFKVVGRYDGKPHNEKAFVKIVKGA